MDLPIADAERDQVIATLQRGHASGYLDQASLNSRMEVALATTDAAELRGLIADLPDLVGRTWSPGAHQQLSPYQAPQPSMGPFQSTAEPAWRQFVRNAGPSLVAAMVAVLLVVLILSPSGGSWWWFFWIFIIFVRPALRTHQQRRNLPRQPYPGLRPNPQNRPPRVEDRYHSEGRDDGDGGQWNQPPNGQRR